MSEKENLIELFGKIDGIVVIEAKGKYYQVKHIKVSAKLSDEVEKFEIEVFDIEKQKDVKFKLKAKGFMNAFLGMIEAEKETKCKQVLLINMDIGEWASYPITEELKKRCSWLRILDKLDYIR